MNDRRVCVPLDTEGTIRGRLGQAHVAVTCRLTDQGVTEWTEHAVDWDNNYGVTVYGVHHPRVIKFLKKHDIDLVVGDEVCDTTKQTLSVLGIEVRDNVTRDPRQALEVVVAA